MLVAVLNTCSQEELRESPVEESVVVPPVSHPPDSLERRRIVRSKILAVGRMARVFSLLRLAIFPFPFIHVPMLNLFS
jgi:serine/threonine-protein phosphatase 2B catalytic subunit